MGVRFVIGRAGSGKTRRFFRAIVDALREDPLGKPIYWILPKQATFIAEHELTVASGLGGFCRARVLSFDELGRELLAECGGSAVPRVTRLGRQMVLGHLLRKHEPQLRFFSKVARHPGMAGKLEATFAEIERCGRAPAEIEKVLAQVSKDKSADAESLESKLHDILLIYKAYGDYLGQERLDPRRFMREVLSRISQSKRIAGSTIYIDALSELDEFERRLIARLAKVRGQMEISLLLDPRSPVLLNLDRLPEELGTFHPVEDTYRRLMKAFADEAVVVEPPVVLHEIHRFSRAALAELEAGMCATGGLSARAARPEALADKLPVAHFDPIALVEAANRRAEVERAARHIRQLLAAGLRMRDIVVLTRKIDLYADLINAVFREHEIHHFIDMRRPMSHHPLLVSLRAVLEIAREDWPHDAAMMLIKSGLSGLSDEQADRLENYVLEHHLRGPAVWTRQEPWNWRRELTRGNEDEQSPPEQDQSAEMDMLRKKIRDGLAPFVAKFRDGKATLAIRETVVALYELFERFGIPSRLSEWIAAAGAAGDHEQAGEHERAWGELVELLDELVDLLGVEAVTLADFQEILEAGLETFSLAIAPPTVDQVLVGQIDRTRTHAVRAVLVLGMNEGVFPCAAPEVSILSDLERLELERRQFELEPGTERRLLDEDFLAYLAFTRASEHLYLSRSLADDAQRPLAPSPYWHRVLELFPELKPYQLPRDDRADPATIGTPRQFLTALMRWAREQSSTPAKDLEFPALVTRSTDAPGLRPTSPEVPGEVKTGGTESLWPSLYNWLAQYPRCDDALDRLRSRAWRAVGYHNNASLSPHIAQQLFPTPLPAAVQQIENFATCPFKHFLRYAIALEGRDEQDVLGIDLDNAFHRILESIVRQLLRKKAGWDSLSPQQSQELVGNYARQIAESLRGEMMLSNARNRYLLGRIERELETVIASQQAIAARGQFKTAFARLDFGTGIETSLPPLEIPTKTGRELHIHGHIDRVDLLESEAAFAVLDYRLRGTSLNFSRIYHGLSLQLLTYMLVVQEHGQELAHTELTPAAAFYVRLLRQLEKVDHPEDAVGPDDPAYALGGKQRGIFDGRYHGDLDGQHDTSDSHLTAMIKKDGTFGNKSRSDVAEGEEMPGLLRYVRRQIAELGERILDGDIEIRPYRMGTNTPCSSCAYHSVCRFEPATNRYRHIAPKTRDQVLKEVCEGVEDE